MALIPQVARALLLSLLLSPIMFQPVAAGPAPAPERQLALTILLKGNPGAP
jgi:hypothetical protein